MKTSILSIIFIAFLGFFTTSCQKEEVKNSKTYVLVHGAWHGKWSWNKVQTMLEAQGHKVVAVDLPSHGDDKTDIKNVNLDAYINRIVETVNAQNQKVILVGHSMGGIAISGAAEKVGDKIESLVYLAAFLPKNGESLFSLEGRNPKPTLPPNLVPSADQMSFNVKDEAISQLFYNDCTASDVSFAKAKLTPQAIAPLATPVSLSDTKYGIVPRYYIECTKDNAISIELQRDMQSASPCKKVFTLETGHSPFFSAPDKLSEILLQF
jgi:pimeloyl-ACP methyl ester carboxylesterase